LNFARFKITIEVKLKLNCFLFHVISPPYFSFLPFLAVPSFLTAGATGISSSKGTELGEEE